MEKKGLWDGHSPQGDNGMANKYVTSPCIPHHPRYTGIGVETKYVYVAKEGAEGTTQIYTCIHTRTTPIYPYDHRCQAPARYMKTETRSRRNMVWKNKRVWEAV